MNKTQRDKTMELRKLQSNDTAIDNRLNNYSIEKEFLIFSKMYNVYSKYGINITEEQLQDLYSEDFFNKIHCELMVEGYSLDNDYFFQLFNKNIIYT